MKCLICGSVNSPSRQHCSDCNAPLPRDRNLNRPEFQENESRREVPEWRKEVHEKVRAYGERKKRLTTPPNSWKEPERKDVPASQIPVDQQDPVETVVPQKKVRSPEPAGVREVPAPQPQRLEIWNSDLSVEEPGSAEEKSATDSLFLGRRFLALLVDSTIIVILLTGVVTLLSWVVGESLGSFLISGWRVWVPVALLVHSMYYLYFYKASRQTPGLLFMSLEIRDPANREIALHKIVLRWLSMIVLNILNLLPLLAGKKSLLLDDLSGTYARSMK